MSINEGGNVDDFPTVIKKFILAHMIHVISQKQLRVVDQYQEATWNEGPSFHQPDQVDQ